MVSLGLLLMVQAGPGGFGLSGAVAGAFGVGNVVAAPLRARMVDRYGTRRVLPLLAVGYSGGLVTIVLIVSEAPGAVTTLLAAFAGVCAPPLGAVMRGVWASVSPTDGHRSRAYSLDAVVEELIFIVGPLLVALAVLLPHGPSIAVLFAAVTGFLGALGLALAPAGKPRQGARLRTSALRGWVGPLRHARFWPVLSTLVAVGIVLGATEVLSTAHGRTLGDPGLAGVILACFAAGSVAGGLLYGVRSWVTPPLRRTLVFGFAACFSLLSAAWANGLTVVLILFFVIGLFVAPSMITGYLAADDIAAVEERTEASALINTAVNAGAAIALALGGAFLTQLSTTSSTVVLAAAAGGCVVISVMTAALNGRTRGDARVTT